MTTSFKFNRWELAGSLGDLGTLLPMAVAMILANGLQAPGVFLSIGAFYVLSGLYFRVTVPVQPMKVIGAYAIATGLGAEQIGASALLMGLALLLLGLSGAMGFIGRHTPREVVRGVQLSTGVLLISKGAHFIAGTSFFQQLKGLPEPFLAVQHLGPLPVTILLGVLAAVVGLLLLDSRRWPAGLVLVLGGMAVGLVLGGYRQLHGAVPGFFPPAMLPWGWPGWQVLGMALLMLVLPQLPMTLGNAVIANADLSREYFGDASRRVTYRALCLSMGLANLAAFALGGMPLCHGAGGLAAHYRFGARTAGSNLIIGGLFLLLALLWGERAVSLVSLLPMSVLGVLLIFAGGQLALTVQDLKERRRLFVALMMLGLTLAFNLAVAFVVGMGLAWLLRRLDLDP